MATGKGSDLEVKIGANLAEIRAALAALRGEVAGVGAAASKAGSGKAFGGIKSGASEALGLVKQLVAAVAAIAGVGKLIGAADELNSLNARLKLVTGSAEEYADAQVKLFDLAQRTRSSLGETIGLYSRIANATKDAGVGQETLLQVVETINQAVQLSGASAQAAEAALVQLGQGLASGTLRGEELNSILEQTPALADAIAKGLGVTRGELRRLGQEGKLTAEQVVTSLRSQREEVARQFAQLPLTVGQSVTLLKNAGLGLVGAFDTVSGATSGLAGVIEDLAEFISSPAVIGAVVEFAKTWSDAFSQIVGDAREAVRIIQAATADIVGTGEDAVQLIIRAFKELPTNLRALVRLATVFVAEQFDLIVNDARALKEQLTAIFSDDTIEAASKRAEARASAIKQAAQDTRDQILAERDAALAAAKQAADAAVRARDAARNRVGSTSTGTFRPANDPKAAAAAARQAEALRKAQLDAEEKLAADSAKRQLGILEQLYEDSQIAAAEYYRRRQEIELAAIDRSIALERERVRAGGTEAVKALAEIELLERAKGDIQRQAARERAAAERALDRETEQLRAQALEQSGQVAAAASLRLEGQYRDLIAKLQTAGNTEGVKLIRGLIDAGVAQAQFDEIKRRFDQVIADLQARQQQLADQRNAGALTPAIADQEASAARQQAEAELQRLNEQLQALAANTNNPAIKQGAQEATEALRRLAIDGATGLDRALIDLRASLASIREGFAQSTVGAGVDALTELFRGVADGSKSAKEALRDFVRNFAASMAQIAARALATYAVLQLLELVFPGAGKLVAVSANVQHAGGMAGTGPKRTVDPMAFFAAPRLHNGSGPLGLKPDEVPAILQTGERVLSRQEVAAERQGGGGTRIVNVIDPNLVGDYLSSSSGERTIVNVIERNAGAIRQKLVG